MIPLALAQSDRSVAVTPEVSSMLDRHCPVAIGVSGGKDSTAVAFATAEYLDGIGHRGPRLLIHADLGVTEWRDSLPTCERLARALSMELAVVRRPQGDMMDRWEQRWRDNVARWESLSCVKLILPWSTPAMRFCTAELKIDQITRYLSRRFAGQSIVSVTGIRREESTERAKAPISAVQPKLASTTRKTDGMNWNPIIDWTTEDVFALARERGFPMHEAYSRYGSSRVSCVYCILGTAGDHQAGARAVENLPLARRQIALEIRSTFAFQGSRWLADTLAASLPELDRATTQGAKDRARRREEAEGRIPDHLLYCRGWPTCVLTEDEAKLIAGVRSEVADAVGLRPTFTTAAEVVARYEELVREKERRNNRAEKKTRKKPQ